MPEIRPDLGSAFAVSDRRVGPGQPCLIIAEIAQAHDGSLGTAHAYIEAAARAGADAVKFQTHIAAAESTPAEPWRVKFSRQDASRYDYWKRMEFSEEQWAGLARHARDLGLLFLSSPFSIEAVDLLLRVGVPAWKIASGELGNAPMLDRVFETRLPVLLSSGMSPLSEVDALIRRLSDLGIPRAVMQCTTAYPCPPEKVGLNLIPFFRERYGCPVGLSDHSGTIYPALAAAALGLNVVEVHVTFSREAFGPDVPASLTLPEFRQMTEGIRFVEKMNASPVDKDAMAVEMTPLRNLFTRSLVAKTALPRGTVLRREDLAAKKPGTGLPARRLDDVVGRRLRRDLAPDELLSDADLE